MRNVKDYIIYSTSTGEISYRGNGDVTDLEPPQGSALMLNSTADINSQRIDLDTLDIVPKYTFPPGVWLGDIYSVEVPVGATVLWQAQSYTVDDGVFEVLIDQPGPYRLILVHPLYNYEDRSIENPNAN